MMKKTKKSVVFIVSWLLVLFMAAPPWLFAQDQGDKQTFSQAELDQMLAPIALYPDSLLAQILMASTYPLELVMADRWVRENKGLQGDQLNAELDKQDWDPSVKALVPFPQVLAMMSEKLDWTERLGDAFLDQQDAVMDTIQKLRGKAEETGNLKSGNEQMVTNDGGDIEIAPTNPEVIYVPVYNPNIVYGPWWYPDYPPFWYYPPGFVVARIVFSFPFFCTVGPFWWFGWGHWDWHHHSVFVNVDRHININRSQIRDTHIRAETWHHDVAHRRGVLYGHEADRVRFGQTSRGSVDTRRIFRGFSPGSSTSRQLQVTPQTVPQNRGLSTSRVPQGTPQTVPQTRGPSTSKMPQGTFQTVPQGSGPAAVGQGRPERGTNRTIFGGGTMDRGSDVRIQRERGFQSRGSMSPRGGTSVGPRGGGFGGGGHGGAGQGGGGGHGGGGGGLH
jgi:hypothetical protein